MINHFAVLGVAPDADLDALRSAYRQRARTLHPDRGGDRDAFHALRESYDTLRNPAARRRWERAFSDWLRSQRGVLCPRCGETNRVPPDVTRLCHACDAPLPQRPRMAGDALADVGDRLRTRAAQLSEAAGVQLVHVGERIVGHASNLLIDGVDEGIGKLRRKLGLDRGRR